MDGRGLQSEKIELITTNCRRNGGDSFRIAVFTIRQSNARVWLCLGDLVDLCSFPSKKTPGAREFMFLFPMYPRGTVWDAVERHQRSRNDTGVSMERWPFACSLRARSLKWKSP